MGRPLVLLRDSFPDRPAFDISVSRALLHRVSEGSSPGSFRLHRPGPMVAFGRQDVIAPGYAGAVRAARAEGFEAVERLAGGRAAVFHEGTIAFSWSVPDLDPRATIRSRFEVLDQVVVAALRGLGVEARVGQIPGEYCPGTHSVNARGQRKIMGVGQRLTRTGAHVGGVVVVGGSQRLRGVLVPVYAELGLEWDPSTAGSVEDEVGAVGLETVEEALLAELGERFDLVEGRLDPDLLAAAERLAPQHRSP